LELWDNNRQQLQDDRRRDVRHYAKREDRELGESATGEEVQQANKTGLLSLIRKIADSCEIDAWDGDLCAKPIESENEQREQDLVTQIMDPESVPKGGKHVCPGLLFLVFCLLSYV
jgi:hypothetical protein